MTVRCSIVDHSALPANLLRVLAVARLHQAVDRHYALRMSMSKNALAPPGVAIFSLGGARFALLSLEASDAAS